MSVWLNHSSRDEPENRNDTSTNWMIALWSLRTYEARNDRFSFTDLFLFRFLATSLRTSTLFASSGVQSYATLRYLYTFPHVLSSKKMLDATNSQACSFLHCELTLDIVFSALASQSRVEVRPAGAFWHVVESSRPQKAFLILRISYCLHCNHPFSPSQMTVKSYGLNEVTDDMTWGRRCGHEMDMWTKMVWTLYELRWFEHMKIRGCENKILSLYDSWWLWTWFGHGWIDEYVSEYDSTQGWAIRANWSMWTQVGRPMWRYDIFSYSKSCSTCVFPNRFQRFKPITSQHFPVLSNVIFKKTKGHAVGHRATYNYRSWSTIYIIPKYVLDIWNILPKCLARLIWSLKGVI